MPTTDELTIRQQSAVELQHVLPLLLGMLLLTVGLAMFLSGTTDGTALLQPSIVVFGGTTVALLASFSVSHVGRAMQDAVDRGIRGGTSAEEMVRAMMKVCDISRRDGLLGVADVRTDSPILSDVCQLIGDAADEESIQDSLVNQRMAEVSHHKMYSDVFLFAAAYAVIIGCLGSVIRAVSQSSTVNVAQQVEAASHAVSTAGMVMLPAVIGISLALILAILLARLRAVHYRQLAIIDLAYRGTSIILEDNNVQRLKNRLLWLLPQGIR